MARDIKIRIIGEDKTGPAFSSASKGAGGFGKSVKGLLPLIGVAGFAGALGGAIKATADFEQQMGDLSTLFAGDATGAIDEMREGIQDLLKVTPKTPQELGSAAYAIVSAGITDTAEALDVLEASTKLAVAGLGTTDEATTLMTLALNNFRDSGMDAAEVSDVLFKTVKNGITNVQQLSQSFGLVAPLAVEAGISLQELQAATAALTQVNNSASISQNSIKAALVSLGKPTKVAIELFDKLGVSTFKELVAKTGGMVNAFQALEEATDGDSQAFARAIGSGEALSSVMALLGSQSESYTIALEDMMEGHNAVDEATKKQNEQFNAQYQILKNNINVEFQKLAIKILPTLTEAMSFISETVIPAMKVAWDWLVDGLSEFLLMIGRAIDKLVALKNAAVSAWGSMTDAGGSFLYEHGVYNQDMDTVFGIPKFAAGGTVPGPVGAPIPAIVHGGEQIIPLGSQRGSGGGITVNINGGQYLSEDAADEMGNLIVERLRTNFRF